MKKECWLPVVGYEAFYEVSDHGRVRSVDRTITYRNGRRRHWRGQVLKSSITSSGYPAVQLCRNGTGKTAFVHSLVAEAFFGPRPIGKQVAHKDGDKNNPTKSNLKYATPIENEADKVGHGTTATGNRNGLAKLTDSDVTTIRQRLGLGEKPTQIAREFGVTQANISAIKLRRTWSHL